MVVAQAGDEEEDKGVGGDGIEKGVVREKEMSVC